MNIIKTILLSTACALFCNPVMYAKPIFVFDIHGVLLAEDLGSLVHKRIISLQQTTRSIKENQYFQQLCSLMKQYRPLGQPVAPYSSELYHVPFEVFALFSGLYSPDAVYTALRSMLATAKLDDSLHLILTALIDTIFQHHERVSALTPIPSGVALLKACLAQHPSDVYIYTNAPKEWIAQYTELFPTIFAGIDDSHIWCSGSTGILKPSPAVFTFIAQHAQCDIPDIIYIDDSHDNCITAHECGATALLFSAPTRLKQPVSDASCTHTKPENI